MSSGFISQMLLSVIDCRHTCYDGGNALTVRSNDRHASMAFDHHLGVVLSELQYGVVRCRTT